MLGEHALIARIRQRLRLAPDWLVVDIGDDAAVVRARAQPARGHHDRRHRRRRARRSPVRAGRAIGHRAVAVNLSDLAAMGATPRLLTLSLALPDGLPVADFDGLVEGLELAERADARLVGGNITRTPGPLVVDVTAIGSVHRRRILRRAGARAGDYIFVSGAPATPVRAGAAGLRTEMAPHWPAAWHVTCTLSPGSGSDRSLARPDLRPGGRSERRTRRRDGEAHRRLRPGCAITVGRSGLGCGPRHVVAPRRRCGSRSRRGRRRLRDRVHRSAEGRAQAAAVARACEGLALTHVGVVTNTPGCWIVDAGRRRAPLGRGYEHFSH